MINWFFSSDRVAFRGGFATQSLQCAVFVTGLCVLFSGVPLRAAVRLVPAQHATIQAGINAAADGDTVRVAPGVYREALTCLNLNKRVYVVAEGAAGSVVVEGDGSRLLLHVENDGNGSAAHAPVFDGVTFRGGYSGVSYRSAVTVVDSRSEFTRCTFEDNVKVQGGGAVLIYGPRSYVVFSDCVFEDNSAREFGGAVLVNGGHCRASFKRCRFSDNTCRGAGASNVSEGGAILFSEGGGEIYDCVFERNSCVYAGGAVMGLNWWDQPQQSIVVKRSRFDGNFAQKTDSAVPPSPTEGGGIMVEANVTLLVEDCEFVNNWADAGGAIHSYRSPVTIRRSTLTKNTATGGNVTGYGGAIGMRNSDVGDADRPEAPLVLEHCYIADCVGPVGGAITYGGDDTYSHRGQVTMTDVVIARCLATTANGSHGNGGGLLAVNANVTMNGCWVIGNRAEGTGGALMGVRGGSMTLSDCLVVDNDAAGSQNVFYGDGSTVFSHSGSTVAYNNDGATTTGMSFDAVSTGTIGRNQAATVAFVSPAEGDEGVTTATSASSYYVDVQLYNDVLADTDYTFTSGSRALTETVGANPHTPSFGGVPRALPGRVEAEDFDVEGRRASYSDFSDNNEGGAYRPSEAVGIAALGGAGNGHVVAWVEPGEWLDFTVDVKHTGTYDLRLDVASPVGGLVRVDVDGVSAGGVLNVPTTGGWGTLQTLGVDDVSLSAGVKTVRITAVTGGFNIDGMTWIATATTPVLSVSPRSIRAFALEGKTSQRSFSVKNSGIGSMQVGVQVASGGGWLSVAPASATLLAGQSRTFTVTCDATALLEGDYSGEIDVNTADAPNSPMSVNVPLRVRAGGVVANDFDGDGRSDIGCYYPPLGKWYLFQSTEGFFEDQFGYNGTVPVTGDYDGDGITDIGCYYAPLGKWYLFKSSEGFFEEQFGYDGTVPLTGDFDGDGRTDLGCYYPKGGNWYVFRSRDGFFTTQFGFEGTVPVTGDFDGDGVDDFGYYHAATGQWKVRLNTGAFQEWQFGYSGTVPVVGDFDGDGTDDLGCYYAPGGNWYVFKSTEGFWQTTFGYSGTQPVVGDFDGDGRSDLGCYYAPGGNWYVFKSTEGFWQTTFGYSGTIPLGTR